MQSLNAADRFVQSRSAEERQRSMYGCLQSDIDEAIATSLYVETLGREAGLAMLITSILSDAQEELSFGTVSAAESARQYINRAKYVLNRHLMQRGQ